MRIAMIGHKQMEGCEGGIEKTVRELSARLAAAGHEVTVYDRGVLFAGKRQKDRRSGDKAPAAEKQAQTELNMSANAAGTAGKKGSVRVRRVPTLPGAAEVPLYSLLACLKAAFSRADVVMIHASGPCVMIPAAKLTGKKVIAYIHGLDSHSSKWGRFAKWYLARGERRAAKSADALLLLSEHIRDHFRTMYGRSGIPVQNGVSVLPDCADGASVLQKYGLAPGSYVLWVGRISREKGLHTLLTARKDSGLQEKLVLAGQIDPEDRYYGELNALAGDDESVVFAGYQTLRELGVLYRNAKFFVFPSEQEGMPHALLEALSCGTPCLLSDIPENRAVAGAHALYFKTNDKADLGEKLQAMTDDPALRRGIAMGAAEDTLKRFSWDRAAERIEAVCRHVVQKKR